MWGRERKEEGQGCDSAEEVRVSRSDKAVITEGCPVKMGRGCRIRGEAA